MLNNYRLIFESGNIISAELLRHMHEVPEQLITAMYTEYSDGIISGMRLSEKNGRLAVSDGIFKLGNELFILENEQLIGAEKAGEFSEGFNYKLIIDKNTERVCFEKSGIKYPTIQLKSLRLKAVPETESGLNDYVFCRFKGVPKLPSCFADLTKNKFDMLYPVMSSYGEASYLPQVFEIILKKIKDRKIKHPLDYTIISEISRFGYVTKELLTEYVSEAGFSGNDLIRDFIAAIKADKPEFKISVSDTPDKTQSRTENNPEPWCLP